QRCMVARACTKRLQNFPTRCAWVVLDAETNRRRAPFEALCNQILDLRDLIIAGGTLNGVALRRAGRGPDEMAGLGSSHDNSTCAAVVNCSSIVDEPLA